MPELWISVVILANLVAAAVFAANGAGWMLVVMTPLCVVAFTFVRWMARRNGETVPGFIEGLLFHASIMWLLILAQPIVDALMQL